VFICSRLSVTGSRLGLVCSCLQAWAKQISTAEIAGLSSSISEPIAAGRVDGHQVYTPIGIEVGIDINEPWGTLMSMDTHRPMWVDFNGPTLISVN